MKFLWWKCLRKKHETLFCLDYFFAWWWPSEENWLTRKWMLIKIGLIFFSPTVNFKGFFDNYLVLWACLFVKNLIVESNDVSKSGLWFKIRQLNPEISLLSWSDPLTASKLSKFFLSKLSNFPFQTVKIFLSKLSKFYFFKLSNFPFQTVKNFLFQTVKNFLF